ncbi:MAG: hypothetical protein ACRCYO_08015 [Bacteroidia bacterium]
MDSKIIKLENASEEKWISPLPSEIIEADELKKEIQRFVSEIKHAVSRVYPELNELEMLNEWYKSILD